MGHDTQVVEGFVHWFDGYDPVAVAGECDHPCAHRSNKVIAWGPSLTLYELVECCDCRCRAWRAALPGSRGGIRGSHPYMKPAGEGDTQ